MRKLIHFLNAESTAMRATVIACAVLAVTDVVGSIVAPDYSATRETTSQLMSPDVRYAWLVRTGAFVYAALLVPFALRISLSSYFDQPWRTVAAAGIWAHIALGIAVAVFQNDVHKNVYAEITVNKVHDIAAILMFGAGMVAVLVLAVAPRLQFMSAMSKFSILVFGTMLVAGLVFAMELHTDLNGIYERVIAVTFMVWLVATAFSLRSQPNNVTDESGLLRS